MPDPVDRGRELAGRAARMLRNAADRATGTEAVVGQSPRTLVWREGRTSLWRYDSDDVTIHPPVLLTHSLVSRAFILDLQPGNSFVERMVERGFQPYLLDFGEPDARDAGNTLATYADRLLPAAVAALLADSGSDDLLHLGYCFGGNLVQLSLSDPEGDLPGRAFAAMAVPVDYHAMGFLTSTLLGDVEVDDLLDASGNLPVEALVRAFSMLQPTNGIAADVDLLAHLDDDRWLAGYDAMSKWLEDQVPFPGAALRDTAEQLVRRNGLVGDGATIAGRPRRLAAIDVPVLVIAAQQDTIVPAEANLPQVELYGGAVDLLEPDAGHVGIVAGRQAATRTIPGILDWLEHHADG